MSGVGRKLGGGEGGSDSSITVTGHFLIISFCFVEETRTFFFLLSLKETIKFSLI